MDKITSLGFDSSNQPIIPLTINSKLSVHTNRHPNTNGTLWGWIDGCTMNICWSDDSKFTKIDAMNLATKWNTRQEVNNEV